MPSYAASFNVSCDKAKTLLAAKESCLSMAFSIASDSDLLLIAKERFSILSLFWPTKLTLKFSDSADGCLVNLHASSFGIFANTHNKWVIKEFSDALKMRISSASSSPLETNAVVRQVSSTRDPGLLQLDSSILKIKEELSEEESINFQIQYQRKKKSVSTGLFLSILLGGWGSHKFWLGENKSGVIYFLLVWTLIPVFLGWIDACFMGKTISTYNHKIALQIVEEIKSQPS